MPRLGVFCFSEFFNVRSMLDLRSASYRRLFKRCAGAKLLQNTGFFEFLLKTLQGLVNRLVFFDVDDNHAVSDNLGCKYSKPNL